ncbi:hypothetical protein NC651_007899 [Populus alba x Populus x berolinensis]|nr:hypothetical protein NC651_007899 [Populus alba x Populus x berolinensis]
MKRRQGASAAEKKVREHPPREKKREKQGRSAVQTVKPQDSHTVHGGEPVMNTGDWRIQLRPDSRKRIVDKIMETLKRHLLFSGQEGLQELKKFAIRFEEKIYITATNQSDYLRKTSLDLSMEIRSQNAMPTAPMDPAGYNAAEH